jgi:hypothetical protein
VNLSLYLLSDPRHLPHLMLLAVRHVLRACCVLLLFLITSLLAWIIFPLPTVVDILTIPPNFFPPSGGGITQSAFPQERSLELTARVLMRLEESEAHEVDPHLRDDIRIAWITVLHAARGLREPHVAATYAVLGMHPDKVWSAIEQRRRIALGRDYEKFFGVAPKKPARSERRVRRREEKQDDRAA